MSLDIKAAIKANGLEVKEVARRMGITPTALAQHINGKSYKGSRVPPNPSLDVLQRIADAIGCDITDLFSTRPQASFVCPHCGKPLHIDIK